MYFPEEELLKWSKLKVGFALHYTGIKKFISNGNRTEWSPIRTVIIRVINNIGRPRSGSPICLITSMITDWIGRHEVLLPINHNFNKICDTIGYFLNQNTRNSKFCFANSEKKSHLSARVMARTIFRRSIGRIERIIKNFCMLMNNH